jgi:citrate lyase subunit beta-like protein
VLPKVHSVEELEIVTDAMEGFGRAKGTIHFVATIESALALHNLGSIAAWRSVYGPGKGGELKALLVTPLPLSRTRYRELTVFYSLVWSRRLYDTPFYSPRECPNRNVLDCADASVVRTPSRQELLYPRSKIAVTARAFGIEAIDMVGETSTPSII